MASGCHDKGILFKLHRQELSPLVQPPLQRPEQRRPHRLPRQLVAASRQGFAAPLGRHIRAAEGALRAGVSLNHAAHDKALEAARV